MALKPNQIRMVENDTSPNLRGTIYYDDGVTPFSLAGSTVAVHVKFSTPLTRPCTIADPATGVWECDWQVGDITEVGTFAYEIQVTDSLGKVRTWNRHGDTDKLLEMVVDSEVA